ncbi:hypothetical protein HDV05_001654, partial [Chytridiales sp. JEL 0842]
MFNPSSTTQPSVIRDQDVFVTQKWIKLKTYWSCGVNRVRKVTEKGGVKTLEEVEGDGTETWITLNDFCKSYRYLTIYHNQGSFKQLRTIQNIIDPIKPVDSIRIPPVLYLQDPTRECSLVCLLSTFGRCKNESVPQITSVTLEPYDWKSGGVGRKPGNQVIRFTSNGSLGTFFKIPMGNVGYKFAIDCPTSFHLSLWSRDEFCLEDESKFLTERGAVAVRDIDESFPSQQAGSWFVMF